MVGDITVPTLFLQGTVDTLFPLQQAIENATALDPSVPVKMIWYCGGHGACLTLDQDQQDAQSAFLVAETLDWLDTYVTNKGTGAPPPVDGPKFEWVDQKGNWYASQYLPSNAGQFNGPTIPVSGDGGILPIVPVIGGSGPQNQTFFPLSLALGAEARDALDIPVPTSTQTTYIVGAPELTFTLFRSGHQPQRLRPARRRPDRPGARQHRQPGAGDPGRQDPLRDRLDGGHRVHDGPG